MAKTVARALVCAAVLTVLGFSAFAQDVDEPELSSVAGRPIEFINYVGPYARVDSAEDIRNIGRSLGRAVAAGATRSGSSYSYSVIHAVDPAVELGLDADILTLGQGARVDHIKNLRRIIAGYLEGAYGYNAADADTLAVFVTIYNAVYRGNMAYLGEKYKPVVTRELSDSTAGLSVRWDEWAGRSRIVIPLTARAAKGVIGSVDTTPISDQPSVQALGKEDSQAAIDERQDLVDIKERDVEQEKAAIEEEKERIAAEEQAIEDERQALEDQAAAGQPGDDQEASLAVSEEAKAEEAALAEREEAVAEAKEDVAEREEAVAAKEEEIAQDRQDIASAQKEEIAAEVAAAEGREAAGVVLFELMDPNVPLARVVLVELSSGDTLRKSDVNTIRSNSVVDVGDAFVAVAGQTTGMGGAVRLVRVSKADYKDVTYGTVDVFADTPVWEFGSSVYAVVAQDGGWAIGRFDPETLEMKAVSAPVSRYTFLTETGGKLVAQKPTGGFLVLDRDKLSTVQEVER